MYTIIIIPFLAAVSSADNGENQRLALQIGEAGANDIDRGGSRYSVASRPSQGSASSRASRRSAVS